MSAPRPRGRWKKGLRKVLSTTSSAPRFLATAASAAMSQIFMSGFVGVSIHNIAKSPAIRSKAVESLASRNANSTP